MDVDSGVNNCFKDPHVENIYFPPSTTLVSGNYTVSVWKSCGDPVTWKLEIFDVNGVRIQTSTGQGDHPDPLHTYTVP